MTKFILVLYLCSMVTGKCPSSHYAGFSFKTHYDCVVNGYGFAQQTFKRLTEDYEEFDVTLLETNKMVVKFECKELNIIVPKPKPKVPA